MSQIFFTSAPESYDFDFIETLEVVGFVRATGDPIRMVRCYTKNEATLEDQRKQYHGGHYFFMDCQSFEKNEIEYDELNRSKSVEALLAKHQKRKSK